VAWEKKPAPGHRIRAGPLQRNRTFLAGRGRGATNKTGNVKDGKLKVGEQESVGTRGEGESLRLVRSLNSRPAHKRQGKEGEEVRQDGLVRRIEEECQVPTVGNFTHDRPGQRQRYGF